MFTLEMLTKQAAPRAPEPEEAPAVSLPNVFAPALAAPVAPEEKPARVRGWVFVAAFVAMIVPVVGVVAVYGTRTPAPKRVATTTIATTATPETIATTETTTTTTTTATTEARREEPSVHHMPRKTNVTTAATATTVKHEAPKCCPGETEMQCAMRRSVGAACG